MKDLSSILSASLGVIQIDQVDRVDGRLIVLNALLFESLQPLLLDWVLNRRCLLVDDTKHPVLTSREHGLRGSIGLILAVFILLVVNAVSLMQLYCVC